MSQITVPVSKFLRILDYLARINLDVAAIAAAANLAPDRIAQLAPDERLPAQHYSKLYKEAVVQMQTLRQPLPWAAGVGSEAFELMCHCMISAKTLGDALQLAGRFERLVYPLTQHNVKLLADGDTARLSYRIRFCEEDSSLVPQSWDRAGYQDTVAKASGLLVWHALCGWLVGQPLEVHAVCVAAPYLNDAYRDSLSASFHCPVQFEATSNTLVFPRQQLERRLVHTVDSLEEFLDNAVYQLIAIDREPASTSAAIRSLISIDLPSGLPSFTRISEHLHMSESSLRRRLQKENTSYQNLKDEVRCQVAIDKLLNEQTKVAELSEYLGFTEPSSFVRSFKGWTGETPKTYREKMQALGTH
ncbi:MAG: AraC family transcriptional regulator ligand-binding domain-containing protein [Halioglobus sp.]